MIRRRGRAAAAQMSPEPRYTQAEQRERRRNRLSNHLVGAFKLDTEVAEVAGPLAVEVARLRDPRAMRRSVEEIGEAVADVVHVAAGLVAESRVTDGQTRRSAADLATRPRQPSISDEQIIDGTWVDELVLYAGEIAAGLAALLERALPPEAPGLRGELSASERVERALREFDRAARDLERRIPDVRRRQALPSMEEYNAAQRAQRDRARSDAALARFGVSL
ncbi:hypothetical protein [Mycolicibacterium fortuitum]|uniref:hypothetical protein n=1 Tax=Mycolicibacterium fortuitum TaxID=1766 RepID=UPI001CE1E713|nr:hypothetical protein [Mycolicibacterium fortuitum]MCA4726889.1 hypothetical protein [Mycolicibacterium fortuitum]